MNEADSAHTIIGKGDIPLVWGSATSARRQLSFPLFRRFAEALGEFCRLTVYDKRGTGLSSRGNPHTARDPHEGHPRRPRPRRHRPGSGHGGVRRRTALGPLCRYPPRAHLPPHPARRRDPGTHRRRVGLGATVATRGPSIAGGENDVLENTTSLYIGSGLSLLDSVQRLKRSSPHLPTHDVSR